MQEDPQAMVNALQDPTTGRLIEKLIAAGIIRLRLKTNPGIHPIGDGQSH
jgi:hypothetical protein